MKSFQFFFLKTRLYAPLARAGHPGRTAPNFRRRYGASEAPRAPQAFSQAVWVFSPKMGFQMGLFWCLWDPRCYTALCMPRFGQADACHHADHDFGDRAPRRARLLQHAFGKDLYLAIPFSRLGKVGVAYKCKKQMGSPCSLLRLRRPNTKCHKFLS